MNSSKIKVPYTYMISLLEIDWHDIYYAIENGYLCEKAAIEHAIYLVSEKNDINEKVLGLASLYEGESIHPFIDELAYHANGKCKTKTRDKVLYVLLNWIYDRRDLYDDPLGVIENIYADFDYPDVISNLIRYMPNNSTDKNTNQLFVNWEKYLYTQRVIFTP